MIARFRVNIFFAKIFAARNDVIILIGSSNREQDVFRVVVSGFQPLDCVDIQLPHAGAFASPGSGAGLWVK